MGKGDLNFEVNANPEKAIADLAKIVSKQEAMIGKLRQSNTEAKNTGKSMGQMGSGLGKVVGDIGKIATGFLSAQALLNGVKMAIRLINAEYEDLKRKQADAARETMTFAKDFSLVIGESFGVEGIKNLDRWSTEFKKLVKEIPELSEDTATKILNAYKGARPEATWEESKEALQKAGAIVGWQRPVETTMLAGELKQRMPELPLDDIYDLAVKLRSDAGKYIDDLPAAMKGIEDLVAAGIEPLEALSLIPALLAADHKPRVLSSYASSILSKEFREVKKQKGKELTTDDIIQNELAAMSVAQRHEWLKQHPERGVEFFGPTFATVAPMFKPGMIEAGRQTLIEAQEQNVYQQTVAAYGKQKLGQRVVLQAEQEAAVESVKREYGEKEPAGIVREWTTQLLESMPQIGAMKRKLILKATELEDIFGGEYTTAAVRNLEGVRRRFSDKTITETIHPSFIFGPGSGPPITTYKRNLDYSPQTAEVIGVLIDRIQRLAETYPTTPAVGQTTQGISEQTAQELNKNLKELAGAVTDANRKSNNYVSIVRGPDE